MKELPKAYVAAEHEAGILKMWEQSGFFNPDNLPPAKDGERTEPFCIVMPPPNVTGTLHLGHAAMLAIEDLMIRFERMRGKRTLWIPGTDHAAIATQTKVEKKLREATGKTRHQIGREPFLAEVRKFAQESHDTIVNQVKAMGSSCDWSREAYTLDEPRTKAVRTVFKMMYDDGLIYRGTRVVNWDPEFQTTLADDEVLKKETTAKLYTFKYAADFPVTISTTRPETKFGDTGVAVHPSDERYKAFVGQTLTADFCGKQIRVKVVADIAVDPTFGTGALGVTPAHSKIDEDIAGRHGLASEQVIGMDGKMVNVPEAFLGLGVKEARAAVVAELAKRGLLNLESEESVKEVAQALPVSERGGGIVEELPMLQWFIDVNKPIAARGGKTLKELSVEAVRGGSVSIVPERFQKTYFHWMENLRDWCISRQIWFGHQIPVWYRKGVDGKEEIFCGVEAPVGEGWTQDPDSLDTWFSSGLWTFSTLGWPEKTKDLEFFHPTTVLETGYDILFFWVARMILMTTYATGQVPFKNVYLHGLVRDDQGRKMSKSLGNIIDPLEMNAKFGTDATRLALVIGSSPGNDVKLSEQKIEGFRNFANKLWNISRFVLGMPGESTTVEAFTLADTWILQRLDTVTREVTEHMEQYRFSQAGELLRDFTWSEFADWYLEIAKVELRGEGAHNAGHTLALLRHVLRTVLKMWHPFMPFVTETIWREGGLGEMLMIEAWPVARKLGAMERLGAAVGGKLGAVLGAEEDVTSEFAKVQELVTVLRNLRAEGKVPAGKRVKALIADSELVAAHVEVLKALAQLEEVVLVRSGEVNGTVKGVCALGAVALDLAGTVDVAAESARLEKEIAELVKYIGVQTGKLGNADFVVRAPAAVIEKEKAKLNEVKVKLETLEAQLKSLR